ncbi:MAG TPA: hypothetical protein P5186_15785 [Candidatus Paceibacterota bacterium]|nr:hypothetical protein [Candidatus Paceibacterota bacterium]
MPKRPRIHDKRLIGTWRSDRRRTMAEWVSVRRLTERRRKKLSDIFGHLTLRFTRSRLHSEFKGTRDTQEYAVLASDSDSVSIVHWDGLLKERRIQHLHFEGRHYWITLGRNREFFRKQRSANQTVQRTGASRSAQDNNRASLAAGSRR